MSASTLPVLPGAICEKCWSDAEENAKGSSRSPALEYWTLTKARKYDPCTPEEQTGIPAVRVFALGGSELSETARKMLDFERLWWQARGNKDRAIIRDLEQRPTEYYRILNGLVDNALALAYAPDVINRLARLRTPSVPRRWRLA